MVIIDKWITKHPEWFAELRFDIVVGHFGWSSLIDDALMSVEQVLLDHSGDFRIVQIKEKFGMLTIHSFHDDRMASEIADRISEIFLNARARSAHICEICGASARLGAHDLCMSVRCESCKPVGWTPRV
jgi:hypothetical protein